MNLVAKPSSPLVFSLLLLSALPGRPAVAADWMSVEAMREAFVGKTLDGHYGNGMAWSESYSENGRIRYSERQRRAEGNWSFRSGAFCTFYDPSYQPFFHGGCWRVVQTGANCYEFYVAPQADAPQDKLASWNARGWRTDAPATCRESPSV